jgi:RNA polymerase-binding transcription factor DksA
MPKDCVRRFWNKKLSFEVIRWNIFTYTMGIHRNENLVIGGNEKKKNLKF